MRYPCLMYHQTVCGEMHGKYWVALDAFRTQMEYLSVNGYSSIDLSSEKPFAGNKGVLITFDDGHGSNLDAAKELSKRGLKGVFYILKNKTLSDAEYLSEDGIREMSEMGHVIGIHGKDHKWWTGKKPSQFIDEFRETKEWLEDLTGRNIITCSAPGGFVNARVADVITTNFPDMKYIRSSRPYWNDECQSKAILNAVGMHGDMTEDEFREIVTMDKLYYTRAMAIYWAKKIAKAMLGR